MLSSDANEVFPSLAADVAVVLLERNEEDIDIEGREVNHIDVKSCYVLRERSALRWREGIRMGIDSPERHDCDVDYLLVVRMSCCRCLGRLNRAVTVRMLLMNTEGVCCPFILVLMAR